MAKLTRESRLRERRLDKQARKNARKLAPASHRPDWLGEPIDAATGESSSIGAAEPALEAVARPLADA